MADEQVGGEEEVRRVFDALDALEAMEDPKARARAISAFLREQQPRLRKLSALRRDYVLGERRQKVTRKKIADDIGVSPSTVQDIEQGYTGSGRNRPPTGNEKRGSDDGDDGK
ncbi:helix-turn-helix domain-containing protein [Streptomyces sp. SAI-127]|uniref:helix-turn-helix domain-containing protein n=1 Tax=Streptomyces sp. SAI-127 TaxID=2940543 RepID=UPI0024760A30|nr:helix-turn-helix domain-containing protein [Streptomyces sp. SAI-127]MDH6489610.1 AraC-like DNA-binding protein [Streptomyces sp. SAI-127]